MLKYLRFYSFRKLLPLVQSYKRKRRMKEFVSLMLIEPGTRILDLGGTAKIWLSIEIPLQVTILNLPGSDFYKPDTTIHSFKFIEGDATKIENISERFDVVFSNSVIEHVGNEQKQIDFSKQVKKFADRYYIQTPSIWFPIEAHTGYPFWFFLSQKSRDAIMGRWAKKLPKWTEMVKGTTVIKKNFLQELFPKSNIITERMLFIPKSYIAYKNGRQK